SKEEILTGYLNTIYYGRGAYGVKEASLLYFNKDATDLTIAEAAMLAAIPKGPTYYSPFNDLENAYSRQKSILQMMLHENIINRPEYELAIREELQFAERQTLHHSFAPYFKRVVLQEAANILQIDEEEVLS